MKFFAAVIAALFILFVPNFAQVKHREHQAKQVVEDAKSPSIRVDRLSYLVRTRRIELPLPCGNRLLRPARLPVPPRPHDLGRTLRILGR